MKYPEEQSAMIEICEIGNKMYESSYIIALRKVNLEFFLNKNAFMIAGPCC